MNLLTNMMNGWFLGFVFGVGCSLVVLVRFALWDTARPLPIRFWGQNPRVTASFGKNANTAHSVVGTQRS